MAARASLVSCSRLSLSRSSRARSSSSSLCRSTRSTSSRTITLLSTPASISIVRRGLFSAMGVKDMYVGVTERLVVGLVAGLEMSIFGERGERLRLKARVGLAMVRLGDGPEGVTPLNEGMLKCFTAGLTVADPDHVILTGGGGVTELISTSSGGVGVQVALFCCFFFLIL